MTGSCSQMLKVFSEKLLLILDKNEKRFFVILMIKQTPQRLFVIVQITNNEIAQLPWCI